MGRAHAQTPTGFAAVFGSLRGSVLAQSQRDAIEREGVRQLEDAALIQFLEECDRRGSDIGLMARRFSEAWSAQAGPSLAVMLQEDLLREMRQLASSHVDLESSSLGAIVTIAGLGEYEHTPGLTAPAVQALAAYFATDAHPLFIEDDAIYVVYELFGAARETDYYQCLRPLAESLAALVERPAKATSASTYDNCAQAMANAMANAMARIPLADLEGSMLSWVRAFCRRYDNGILRYREVAFLWDALKPYRSKTVDPNSLPEAIVELSRIVRRLRTKKRSQRT